MRRIRVLIFAVVPTLLCGVWITASGAPRNKTHAVSMDKMRFTPAAIEVIVGDSVEWTNNDDRDHSVKGKGFSSGSIKSGGTFRFTFKKPGKYDYACELHPRMKGSVNVSKE